MRLHHFLPYSSRYISRLLCLVVLASLLGLLGVISPGQPVPLAHADRNFTALAGSPNNVKTIVSPHDNSSLIYVGGREGFARSADGGNNWQVANNNLPFASAQVFSLAIDPRNSASVYAGLYGQGVFHSTDGGNNWQAANTGIETTRISSVRVANDGTLFTDTLGSSGQNGGVFKSTDQGASWQRLGDGPKGEGRSTLAIDPANPGHLFEVTSAGINVSLDGGATWQITQGTPSGGASLKTITFVSPATVVTGGFNALYVSTNNGATWTATNDGLPLFKGGPFIVLDLQANSADHSVLALADGDVLRLKAGSTHWERLNDLKDYSQNYIALGASVNGQIFAATTANGLYRYSPPSETLPTTREPKPDPLPSGTIYFAETGHSLGGTFYQYWQKFGGLAQFGYPLTRLFSEQNASDGKNYDVQYFERARFEYHPEFANTDFVVLLGLLGVQQIHGRIFAPATPLGGDSTFFAATKHNLEGNFRKYWNKNGGLFVYGYPLSEEITEISPTDGHSYTVQYFERNRFEYHPEFAGTRYEVLLGLLGVQTLREKGWLP